MASSNRYILNGTDIPRPKRFRREYVEVRTDIETINGKHSKDLTIDSRKEKFLLGWDALTQSEMTTLMAIIELNTSITFQISETNLSIASTSVWPYIKSRNYNISGGSFIESLELELIEVT